MSTAAVGLSPKMVVRSLTDERGSADAPSSRRVSVVTLPLAPPEGGVVTVVEPLALPLAPPDGGVVTVVEPLALPLAPPDGGVVTAEPPGLAGLLPV